MKEEAKMILIKDIVIAVVAWIVGGTIICLTSGGFGSGGLIAGIVFAGVPFGWRWLSNAFTATSMIVFSLKFIFSIFIGWIAIFIIIIKDVITYVVAEN